jgi:hypothetical protein
MVWNTGLQNLTNSTPSTVFIVDLEDPSRTAVLAAGESVTDLAKFPWCENSQEVRRKAFRIHRGGGPGGPVMLHMFQNYRDDTCYFIPGPATPAWSAKQDMGEGPSSNLSVVLGADERPRATAV